MTNEQAIEFLGHVYQHIWNAASKKYDAIMHPLPVLCELGEADRWALEIVQSSAIELSADED